MLETPLHQYSTGRQLTKTSYIEYVVNVHSSLMDEVALELWKASLCTVVSGAKVNVQGRLL